ncbi:Asp-tRNA(Asn)/Glu-tRNA(Gln) amidotransferase subunit GatC [Candidatus Kuenenbacteria bacterium]|nr:Asp-tRNA(Asn)/Glu-tRNA(Gln) amidotransferase subunit GatC [Candidatus Kuenenbacteria bacterium]
MQLTIKEVEHVAKLAQLKLTDQEKEKFTKQLSSILDYVKQLDEVDTKNIKPINQIIGLRNITRKDEINKKETEKLLQCAPNVEERYIKIPSVF